MSTAQAAAPMAAPSTRENWFSSFPRRFGRITASHSYVPQIDGLRLIAILQVVIYHAAVRGERLFRPDWSIRDGIFGWLPNGAAGVELFFFISGYIIAFPFLQEAKPRLSDFYKRRLLRLEPPYMLALLLCFAMLSFTSFSAADAPGLHKSDVPLWQSLLASMVYSHQLIFQAPPRLDPPLWSLEIEIQFYLLAPFLIRVYLALGDRVRRQAIGLLLVGVAIVGQVLLPYASAFTEFTLVTHFYAFLLGLVFCDRAVAANPFQMPARRIFDLGFVLGLVLLVLTGALFYPVGDTILPKMATLALRGVSIVLLYLGAARGVTGRRVLAWPWFTVTGGACYSIYLIHMPVLQGAMMVLKHGLHPHSLIAAWFLVPALLVPPAIAAGLVYYVLIERPCMRKDWPRRLVAWMRGQAPVGARPAWTAPHGGLADDGGSASA